MSAWGALPDLGDVGANPVSDASVTGLLRSAADSLAVDLAVWAARDPAAPSPEAGQARKSALATAEVVGAVLARVRAALEAAGQGGCPAGCGHPLEVHSPNLGCWCGCAYRPPAAGRCEP